MLLSTQQKAIIKKIARTQLKSFVKISKHELYDDLLEEFKEEGYDVNDSDFLEYFAVQAELWDSLENEPDNFLNRLDEMNLSMLKHILFQEFELNPETRGIWKKLSIWDKVNENKN